MVVAVTAGELLRTVRRRHGVTQEQLAARARTSQAAISRIERGVVSPSVATLATLVDLLGEELVLDAERVDYGHDVTLNRLQLAASPEERLQRQASWSNSVRGLRGAAGRVRRA
jgi:transcriptional regulator with XRE-family HTH domain